MRAATGRRILLAFNRISTQRMRVVVNSNMKKLIQAAQAQAPSDQVPITWADGSPVHLPLPFAGNDGFHVFLSVRGAPRASPDLSAPRGKPVVACSLPPAHTLFLPSGLEQHSWKHAQDLAGRIHSRLFTLQCIST